MRNSVNQHPLRCIFKLPRVLNKMQKQKIHTFAIATIWLYISESPLPMIKAGKDVFAIADNILTINNFSTILAFQDHEGSMSQRFFQF